MKVEVTPGQRCLLDLLQRKLLRIVELYARLTSIRKQKLLKLENGQHSSEEKAFDDFKLALIREKIKRISAKQKHYIREIMHGNGNNSISKENYLNALGLVTKEASNKLISKPNERRRRTTANPRFSHEAIQAKKALEPYLKRLDPRIRREMILY